MAGLIDNLKGIGQIKLMIMAVVGVAMLAMFVYISLHVASPALTPLYSNLTLQDSGKIVSELEKMNVPYELRNNGAEVLVPADKVLRLRMSVAEMGLPSNGSIVGYEIFDKSDSFGSSSSIVNINAVRALEGEISRTIGSFTQVDSARVHLVMPKRELFSRDKQEPSASIALKLRGTSELSKNEVSAITHFVAAAVPGLKPSRITVVDSYGRMLAKGGDENSMDAAAGNAMEHRIAFERRSVDILERLVEQIVGPGKVKVQVAADMNFDRIVTKSETYDPESQVARSTQSVSETEQASDGDTGAGVTAANNLPNQNAAGAGNTGSTRASEKVDETTNFEISKIVEDHISEGGTIKRLSIAVLVDGVYVKNADGKESYTPRGKDELDKIAALVKSAIGFEEDRGDTLEVVNMQFITLADTKEETSFIMDFRQQMESIIQTLIIAGVAVLSILLVLRPAILHLVKTLTPPSERAQQELAAIAGPAGIAQVRIPGMPTSMPSGGGSMGMSSGGGGGSAAQPEEEEESLLSLDNITGRVKSSSMRKINDFIDKHPDEALGVIRQWLIKESN